MPCPTGVAIECPAAASQDGTDPLTALEVSVLRLKRRRQLITGRRDAVVRNCRQIYDPIFLRRWARSELEFAEFVTAFARVVFDGTNGGTRMIGGTDD